jgi:hypothetical protein
MMFVVSAKSQEALLHTLRLGVRVGVRYASLRKGRMHIWSWRPVLSTFGVGCAIKKDVKVLGGLGGASSLPLRAAW